MNLRIKREIVWKPSCRIGGESEGRMNIDTLQCLVYHEGMEIWRDVPVVVEDNTQHSHPPSIFPPFENL